jgi:regulator of nucleoside diphosphate kinase
MPSGHERTTYVATEEVGGAIQRFWLGRRVALLLVVLAGLCAAHPSSDLLVLCVACLGGALIAAHRARTQLVARLIAEATKRGSEVGVARVQAEEVVESLLHLERWRARRPSPCDRTFAERDESFPASASYALPSITITKRDLDRLSSLLHRVSAACPGAAELLDEELARADIVSSQRVPPDVVTMNSRVRFEDAGLGARREITLVYPGDENADGARVSVLSPEGCALLGLRVGQAIDWPCASGRPKRLRVLDVAYQPEAAGHFHL